MDIHRDLFVCIFTPLSHKTYRRNCPNEANSRHIAVNVCNAGSPYIVLVKQFTGAYYSVLKHTAILKAEAVLFIHFRSQLPAPGTPSIQ